MNLDLDFLISFMSAHTCSESTEKGNKKYNEGYKPVRVVQFLLLAFECNNLFQKPTDSWPMGTVSLPKENRLDSLSRLNASQRRIDTPHTNRVSVLRVHAVRTQRNSTLDGWESTCTRTGVIRDRLTWYAGLAKYLVIENKLLFMSSVFLFSFYKTEIKRYKLMNSQNVSRINPTSG